MFNAPAIVGAAIAMDWGIDPVEKTD